jgi:hypothetical protein
MTRPKDKKGTQLQEELLRAQIEEIHQNIKSQRADETLKLIQANQASKPWWKREPIATATLTLTVLSTLLGFRPTLVDPDSMRKEKPSISEFQRTLPKDRPDAPNSRGSRTPQEPRFRLLNFRSISSETDEQRWKRLLMNTSPELRDRINELLVGADDVFGTGEERTVIKEFVQSKLESMYRTDPLWSSYKFPAAPKSGGS